MKVYWLKDKKLMDLTLMLNTNFKLQEDNWKR